MQTLITKILKFRSDDPDIAVDSVVCARSHADPSFVFTVLALTRMTYSTPPYLGWQSVWSRHAGETSL